MKTRIRILAIISLAMFISMGVISVLFPVSELQFGSSMDTIAYETVAIRDSSGNLSTTNDDIYTLGMGDFNLSIASINISIDDDVESIRVKSVLHREVMYESDQLLNISFSEELSIYYENDSITKQLPEGSMLLESEVTTSSTKPLELTLDKSTIDNFTISNISIQNEFAFRVAASADYTINYVVYMEVIQVLKESPPMYVSFLQILLPVVGIFSAAMLLIDLERSET
ncbi:MAG: hypothetical protein GF309_08425 [Candidatus Lokiarchaeota archaeon]|nr:hypothetical protein [Candidatus Lokiarchaeota archaeon]